MSTNTIISWNQLYSIPFSILGIAILGLALVFVYFFSFRRDNEPESVWAKIETFGVPNGILPWPRAVIASISSLRRNSVLGYGTFIKLAESPFALPTMWTGGAVVVLPPSFLSLLNKPDSELSGLPALLETIRLPYMFPREIYEKLIHFEVVRKKMAKKDFIGSLAATTAEEVDIAFRDSWGTSKEWKTVNGWDACERIITQTSMRILIGLPLCRDETLLNECSLFANAVLGTSGLINCLPPFLRPVVAPVLALPAIYYRKRCQKLLLPLIQERIHQWRESKGGENLPDDFLQWLITKCADAAPEHMDPNKIALRLLASNTMFIFGIAYVFAHCVLDLYRTGSPASRREHLTGLEEECKEVSAKHHGLSTRAAVDSLYRIDSTMRESMRLSDVFITSLPLDVVSGNVDLGNGIIISKGIRMVYPTQAMHLDEDNYENPLSFDAFRFSRPFEAPKDSERRQSEREEIVTCTKSFLVFGYGRHSCPGRWFVSQTVKQALAHIVMNYDVEVVGKFKKRKALLNVMLPPTDAKIRFRRKRSGL